MAAAWGRVHARRTHRGAWLDHDGPLPVIDGTLIRLPPVTCPATSTPSRYGCGGRCRRAARWRGPVLAGVLAPLRPGATFPLLKQVLGSTAPKIRDPQAADRWTWLIIIAHAQLRLARPLADDLRLPWERPAPPGRLTPARVRRGFRNIRTTLPCPAGAPKPGKPGPGRPPGQRTATPHPPRRGKTTRTERALKAQRDAQVKRRAKLGVCSRPYSTALAAAAQVDAL